MLFVVCNDVLVTQSHTDIRFPEDIDMMCANTNITKANNRSVLAGTRETGPAETRLSLWTARYRVSHMG